MSAQPSLFEPPPPHDLPEGLVYRGELISPAEEAALAHRIAQLPFKAFEFRGFVGKRRVVSFGWRYDFNQQRFEAAEPIPDWLSPLRAQAAAFAGLPAESFAQALVTEYAPGAAIGWHRDRPQFSEVVGVSLLAPCVFRLRRRRGSGWDRAAFEAEPRSAYLLSGSARRDWEHSIPPVAALRYSVTFRRLTEKARAGGDARS